MDARENVLAMVKEAKLYREQGLLTQSILKYRAALEAVGVSRETFEQQGALESALQKAIDAAEVELNEVRENDPSPDLSDEMKDLIQRLFSRSMDNEIAEYKGAVALARFGQYGAALKEFNKLLDQGVKPLVAAKNILTCHVAFSSPEVAVAQFEKWVNERRFSREDLGFIRECLARVLEKEGADAEIPSLEELFNKGRGEDSEEIELPISGVCLPRRVKLGREDEEEEELEVIQHTGDTVSIDVPPHRSDLLVYLQYGTRISGMRFFTSIAVFEGRGLVIGRKRIESGPMKNHYSIDIHIETTY